MLTNGRPGPEFVHGFSAPLRVSAIRTPPRHLRLAVLCYAVLHCSELPPAAAYRHARIPMPAAHVSPACEDP